MLIEHFALVTGATSGIGLAFAEKLAMSGVGLVLTGRREELLRSAGDQIAQRHQVPVEYVIGELSESETLEKLLSAIELRPILYLVNNAGFGTDGDYLGQNPEQIAKMIRVHCEVPALLCRAAAPAMVRRGQGFIINVSSMAGFFALPNSPLYSSTKAMLHNFSLAFGISLAETGVRVQSLLPGFTHTDFHDHLADFGHERKSKGIVRWHSADAVATASLKRIRGRGWKRIGYLYGFWNRFIRAAVGLLPWATYRRIARRL